MLNKMLELNKIYNMDCLEFMKKIPDKYFDLIITDPPYGINYGKLLKGKGDGNGGIDKNGWREWDAPDWDEFKPTKEYFDEMKRISKNQIIWGGNYFIEYLESSMCWLVWNKCQREFSLADGELAWTSFNKALRIFDYSRAKFLNGLNEKREHPTQKPVALGIWILNNFAKEGDIIFDPFAGSGSFLLSCKMKGFKYIGCEKDNNYFNIINRRLEQKSLLEVLNNDK